jgi:hypothetical protein
VLSAAEVEAGLATGRLSSSTYSWREGETAWTPLGDRTEFASAIGAGRALAPETPALPFEATTRSFPGAAWTGTVRAIWSSPRYAFAPSPGASAWRRALWFVLLSAALASPMLYGQCWFLDQAADALDAWRGFGSPAPGALPGLDLPRFTTFLLAYPLLVTLLSGGAALLLQMLLRVLGGGRGGLSASVRAVAYVVGVISLSAAIPLLSCLTPFLLFGYLWVALAATHRDPLWRPLLALSVMGFLAACVSGVFFAFVLDPFFRPMG